MPSTRPCLPKAAPKSPTKSWLYEFLTVFFANMCVHTCDGKSFPTIPLHVRACAGVTGTTQGSIPSNNTCMCDTCAACAGHRKGNMPKRVRLEHFMGQRYRPTTCLPGASGRSTKVHVEKDAAQARQGEDPRQVSCSEAHRCRVSSVGVVVLGLYVIHASNFSAVPGRKKRAKTKTMCMRNAFGRKRMQEHVVL